MAVELDDDDELLSDVPEELLSEPLSVPDELVEESDFVSVFESEPSLVLEPPDDDFEPLRLSFL